MSYDHRFRFDGTHDLKVMIVYKLGKVRIREFSVFDAELLPDMNSLFRHLAHDKWLSKPHWAKG